MELSRFSKSEEWTGRLILVAFGIYVLVGPNPDSAKLILGGPLTFGPLIESQEFRVAFKIVVNRVSGKQVFQVQQSHISDSNIVGIANEVHFHEAAQVVAPPAVTSPAVGEAEKDFEVDNEFNLQAGDYRSFPIDLEDGERLVGYVEADGAISCYPWTSQPEVIRG